MDYNKISNLIKLNNSFYIKHQEEFSKSRKNFWKGWSDIVELVNKEFVDKDKVKILDIGCGNGRFFNYLNNNSVFNFDYLGLDNNDYFLIEAILKYKKANYKKIDVILDIHKIKEKFDFIVAFGITHHIPGKKFRMDWINKILKLANNECIFCLSFWNLQSDKRYEKLIKAEDLENNDFYYGWSDSKDHRYVHLFDEEEINMIKNIFKTNKFILLNEYYKDGKNNEMNLYQIYKKNTISYP